MGEVRIGVIGGSGLYEMTGLEVREERRVATPFGDPSDAYVIGELEGRTVAFLARHARGHRLLPTELNYRANILGFKQLGVEFLISVSAVGSMKIDYRRDIAADQFFDRTAPARPSSAADAHTSLPVRFAPRARRRPPWRPGSSRGAPTPLRGRCSRRGPSRGVTA